MANLLYGSGLRLMECLRLRVEVSISVTAGFMMVPRNALTAFECLSVGAGLMDYSRRRTR